jgi:hypothetical protein
MNVRKPYNEILETLDDVLASYADKTNEKLVYAYRALENIEAHILVLQRQIQSEKKEFLLSIRTLINQSGLKNQSLLLTVDPLADARAELRKTITYDYSCKKYNATRLPLEKVLKIVSHIQSGKPISQLYDNKVTKVSRVANGLLSPGETLAVNSVRKIALALENGQLDRVLELVEKTNGGNEPGEREVEG